MNPQVRHHAMGSEAVQAQTERKRDAELRRQDREREGQLRREADDKWERRRRDGQRQR